MKPASATSKGRLLPSAAGRARSVWICAVSLAAMFFLAFGSRATTTNKPVDYGGLLDHKYNPVSQGPDENQMTGQQLKALDFENAIKARTQAMSEASPTPFVERASTGESFIWSAVVLPCVAFAGIGITAYALKRRLDARIRASAEANERRLQEIVEDAGLEGFFVELREALGGPKAAEKSNVASAVVPAKAEVHADSLNEFFASTAGKFAGLRTLVSDLGRVSEQTERGKVLSRLSDEIGSIKESATRPALHSIWVMTCALEGLLRQLSRDAASLTSSTQRTAMAAIDLLEALCVPDLDSELATRPSVRILAVDDDPISCRAISFALKKAFNEPTLAPDGNAALDLVETNDYDVIFLDVEMPGMDGFELCTKIRETARNRTTPVVFVTRHSDFESRKKSALSGGQDLIAKPYHSFEITVKALTLVLCKRLQKGIVAASELPATAPKPAPASCSAPLPVAKPATARLKTEETGRQDSRFSYSGSPAPKSPKATSTSTGSEAAKGSPAESGQLNVSRVLTPPAEHLPDTFPVWSPVYLETLRNQLQVAMLCNVPAHLQELITGLYLSVHSFSVESEHAGLPTIHQLSSALEGMLKKLMEKPSLAAPSVWNSAVAALDLIAKLPCRPGNNPELQTPRILVVDDDPVARRAISASLQRIFGKPDNAGDGETAVEMASKGPFDLIFLDVMMPGIDGFATCSKIREIQSHHHTPIVFISNHDDATSRENAARAGGSGFIPKPVFSSQITLTALTAILHSRLDRTKGDTVAIERDLAPLTA